MQYTCSGMVMPHDYIVTAMPPTLNTSHWIVFSCSWLQALLESTQATSCSCRHLKFATHACFAARRQQADPPCRNAILNQWSRYNIDIALFDTYTAVQCTVRLRSLASLNMSLRTNQLYRVHPLIVQPFSPNFIISRSLTPTVFHVNP